MATLLRVLLMSDAVPTTVGSAEALAHCDPHPIL
jgi:hypothetical protein